jgi:type I restriction-modification system DNA methylase subunit
MNLFLHGIGGEESPIEVGDSLISDPGHRFDIVLTNPPFGVDWKKRAKKKLNVSTTNLDSLAVSAQAFPG